jgi:hypothetical protein
MELHSAETARSAVKVSTEQVQRVVIRPAGDAGRRQPPFLRRAVPSRGRAHAAGRPAVAQLHAPGRRLPRRLDDGAVPQPAIDKIRSQVGRGHVVCGLSGGGRFRGRGGAAARGDRRPADLHLCRYRPVAGGRGGGGRQPLPRPLQHPADPSRCGRVVSR